jgi:hypothetical protein
MSIVSGDLIVEFLENNTCSLNISLLTQRYLRSDDYMSMHLRKLAHDSARKVAALTTPAAFCR